jgi:D-serine deaminase-like pyridoxal phosphate-dependent protein
MTRIEDLDTPAVVVLLDRLEDNITRVQGMISSYGLLNRPHIKTHKIPAIGKLQIKAGAVGLTCQKLGEAKVFIEAGVC